MGRGAFRWEVERDPRQLAHGASHRGGDMQVVDAGCGDGRVCFMAATRYGARAVGLDVDAAALKNAAEVSVIMQLAARGW